VGGRKGCLVTGRDAEDPFGRGCHWDGQAGFDVGGHDGCAVAGDLGGVAGWRSTGGVLSKLVTMWFTAPGRRDDPDLPMSASIMGCVAGRPVVDYLLAPDRAALGVSTASGRVAEISAVGADLTGLAMSASVEGGQPAGWVGGPWPTAPPGLPASAVLLEC